ncbi:MAG TPA: glycosyltransferase [Flavisolibacter sp.]|nr:glycosyltransferase [Flavisolibacter sp.]
MSEVVSIITPCFNRATLVTETAQSILAQTYPHWEWMIVDDGSTDNSWEVLQDLAKKDSRIRIFQRDRGPKGACVCRNIAIEKSTGEYLIFLDTDDILAPFCLEQRVKAMQEQPDKDFLIFSMLLFNKRLDDLNLLWNVDKDQDDLMRMLVNDPVCQGTGTLWKKKTFVEIGMWREDLRIWQDVELHIRSFLWPVKHGKRMDLPPDVYLRRSDDSLSRIGYHDLPKVKSRIEVYLYACERVKERNLLTEYRHGLRAMGCEIVLGMMYNNHFATADDFLNKMKSKGVYSSDEIRSLKIYLIIHRLRLDRIKFIDIFFFRNIKKIAPKPNDSVGVITFTEKHPQFPQQLLFS